MAKYPKRLKFDDANGDEFLVVNMKKFLKVAKDAKGKKTKKVKKSYPPMGFRPPEVPTDDVIRSG